MTLNEWIIYGQVGRSSKTMWAAITGAARPGEPMGGDFGMPHDVADFKRCLRFVQACEVTPEQLSKVTEVFPWFAPFIENWERLVELYYEELPLTRSSKLYALIKELGAKAGEIDRKSRKP